MKISESVKADGADNADEGAALDIDVEVFKKWRVALIIIREVTGLDFDGDAVAAKVLDGRFIELGVGQ